MILTDHDLSDLIANHDLIQNDTYDPDCVTNIGYDLRSKAFFDENGEQHTKILTPGESVMVSAEEIIHMPDNMAAIVQGRNSRIRQGLSVTAPVYQPGHVTRVFFRLTNISSNEISLTSGESHAMIIFEQLSSSADHPYNGTFKDEIGTYTGLSGYKKSYEKQIRQLEEKADDIKGIEKSIYANVLAILAVFVAIFSLISTNVKLLENESTLRSFVGYNLITVGGISFLLTLLRTTILDDLAEKYLVGQSRKRFFIWLPTIIIFVVAFIVLLCIK